MLCKVKCIKNILVLHKVKCIKKYISVTQGKMY